MRRSIIIIGLLAITGVTVFLLIFPKKGEWDSLKSRLQERQASLQFKEEYFANLREISRKLDKYPEELAKIGSALPAKSQVPALFDFLSRASAESGLILKNIGPLGQEVSSEENKVIKEISLNISVSGDFSAFKNFLRSLENSSRLLNIGSISFASSETPKGPGIYSLKIKVFSY